MSSKPNSKTITLREIVENNYFFNIPIYQRLYVWGGEQIETLLTDIWEAYKDKKDIFYLGGTLVIEKDHSELSSHSESSIHYFDLIDGQQRFTTLWLMSLVLCEGCEDLSEYRFQKMTDGLLHRISFAIRPKIKDFFQAKIDGKSVFIPEASQLEDAMAIIESFVSQKQQNDVKDLADFIYNKVTLVFTEVPQNTDLNKLFEIINNRGVQLQHHEILKARLLSKLENGDERERYSQLWDACAWMGDYVEKNLRQATGLKVVELFNNEHSISDKEKLADSSAVLKALELQLSHKENIEMTLEDILTSEAEEVSENNNETDDYESEKIRSIITFPMLLQHVLRIHLVDGGCKDIPRILDKELLSIFEKSWLDHDIKEDNVKSFIKLLWKVRYLFDKYIIKWVEGDEGEVHAIRKLRLNSSSLSRESEDSYAELAMLQSMLYHSQEKPTQYWLTPFLKFLLEYPLEDNFSYLQYLDNQLFCTGRTDTLIERTYKHLNNTCILGENPKYEQLDEKLGTSFPHYWFYKLEFILWYSLRNKRGEKWKAFRITARNSVEHISPQNPVAHDANVVSIKYLNKFGNLALVSRSINSEYSNLPFNEKWQRFLNKNKKSLDSLKMALIYENENWNDDLAEEHHEEMIGYFNKYF